MASWPVVPWESAELGRSAVSTFGLPWTAEGRVGGVRVVPGAGGQLHDAGPDVFGERDAGQAAAAVVEHADAGAVGDAPRGCVDGVHRDRLAAADFAFLAVGSDVELAVQPAAGWLATSWSG